jgi:hypothetical protein
MLIEQFLKSESALSRLAHVQDTLADLNFFGVLLELGAGRSRLEPSEKPQEHAALKAAFHDGYVEALQDLFLFRERYVDAGPLHKAQAPDFGAEQKVLGQKLMTEEEYRKLSE